VTLDDMISMGLGCLKFSPIVFWAMDYHDFCLAMEGHNRNQEAMEQMAWERARWMAAALLSPHAKAGSKIKPTDLAKFPWDAKRKPSQSNLNEAQSMLMSIAKPKI
jgi:hypothetical protein